MANKLKYKVGEKVRNKETGEIVTIALFNQIAMPNFPYMIEEDGGARWWSEYIFEPLTLTLKEQYFRTGYVVEMRNKEKYIVLRDGNEADLIDFSSDGNSHADWESFDEYDDNLNFVGDWGDEEYDIVRVYDRVSRWGEPLFSPIWEREEPKEMTIEEIEALVGSRVKIVAEKED